MSIESTPTATSAGGSPVVKLLGIRSGNAVHLIKAIERGFSFDTLEKVRRLPKDWSSSPAPTTTQSIGDEWARALVSAVLEVPSAIVPFEKNYLLNPAHADYSKITLSKPSKFAFDERLKSS